MAGRYLSINAALRDAGMIKSRTRLHELKNAWAKASSVERRQFLDWVKSPPTKAGTPSPARPVAADRKLEPWAAKRIEEIIKNRRMQPGAVMQELGFDRLDGSLSRALKRNDRIKPSLAFAIEKWLKDNKAV
jgi:hypothetical protein